MRRQRSKKTVIIITDPKNAEWEEVKEKVKE